MKKIFTKTNRLQALCYSLAIAGVLTLAHSCNKSTCTVKHEATDNITATETAKTASAPEQQNASQTRIVNIANMRQAADGRTQVMFLQLAQLFTISDATLIATLKEAFHANRTISVTIDPWKATILRTNNVSMDVISRNARPASTATGYAMNITGNTAPDQVNDAMGIAGLNTTTPGLTNVIPDFATAQMMFNYITHQCCAVPGPYTIDQCISFQYCQDGCYARAHKMCWIINNKYHYTTHKIFSFANSGSDELSVQAQKWGGCCINWWYHVAPLVNVKTPTGTKAYVFDPAMFNQPVLLSVWLHAQENPACSGTPKVSMINIQPTSSYSPTSYSGLTFDTDPAYTATNGTLVGYSPLISCP